MESNFLLHHLSGYSIMKTSKSKLNADFIGGGRPLTKVEEKRISDFLNNREKSKIAAKK